ncbi:restriction endonuclease subunit S [Actinophytocola sediminis]
MPRPSAPLGELAAVRARIGWRGLAANEYTETGPYLVAGRHVVAGRVDWQRCDHLPGHRYRESMEIALAPGDVILSKDGTLGRVARIDTLPGPATINSTMMLVRCGPRLDHRYLQHYLDGPRFQRLIADRMSGSSIPHLFQRDLVDLPTPVPDLAEQRRVAEILDAADDAIRATERVVAKLELTRHGLAADLVDRPGDPVARLADVVMSAVIGPFGSDLTAADYRATGVPVIFVRDVRAAGVRRVSDVHVDPAKAAALAAHDVAPGDVVVTKMGLPPGVAAVYPDDLVPGLITADLVRLRPDPAKVLPEWLAAWVNSAGGQAQVRAITAGVTRAKITLRDFRELRIRVPPLPEQHRVHAALHANTRTITTTRDQLAKLAVLKQALLSDLL